MSKPCVNPGLALLLALAGCSQANMYVEPPPPEVTVTHPVQQSVTEYLEFSGMTQPLETVEIRARVKGFLKERHFVEGADVRRGQLLLVIDEEPFQIQLEAARARLQEAEAALQQATESKAREVAEAQVQLIDSQVQLSLQEEQRVRSLFERQVSTQAEMDQATATRKSREAELASAKANQEQALATYQTAILSGRAQVESARIAVRNSELDLSYCRMTAPIDGRISQTQFDVGNLVGDGQSSVLATIVRMDPIHAYATISEADVLRNPALIHLEPTGDQPGTEHLSLELGLASDAGFPHVGHIDYSDPGLDASTGTLRVRGVFANTDRSLLPGMFVRLRTPVSENTTALLVPERALGTDQSGAYVLVVGEGDKVQQRPVRVGTPVGALRVVEGELSPSDQVIVEGLLRARPGALVTPRPEPSAAVPAAPASASGSLSTN